MQAGNSEVVATIFFTIFSIPFSYIMEIYIDGPARMLSGSLFKIMDRKKE
jgi:hypothetical protein